ncbi:CBS domain-containing protein [Saccharopolyspora phatthalungensis]|uniref:CBS domain-containing protein n=1 Tax=Saccharopolyspora phatthalungensis TaxID=664693 RepID=A0A840QCQ3_9PSEU|nr:CBS domain-containing protein [Saccharopolyspora phatthalungensis]MBB5157631.1 CBS domain-containing protein [Saccharopolyspora phatthalungensis]
MRIADILRNKGSEVATISATRSVFDLMAALADYNIGAMVVTDASGGIVGIVSERDVVRGLNDHGPDVLRDSVSRIMTSDVVTCGPEDSVESLTVVMTERRIRHIPVVSEGSMVGIVSIGDMVKSRIRQLEEEQEQLEAYITNG